jgi:hypothetical protein
MRKGGKGTETEQCKDNDKCGIDDGVERKLSTYFKEKVRSAPHEIFCHLLCEGMPGALALETSTRAST